MRFALGNPDFRLGAPFRDALSGLFEGLVISAGGYVAMDYHLDWIHAAVSLTGEAEGTIPRQRNPLQVGGHHEDVDLLAAFERDGETHIVMLEAKATTGYTNAQFVSKVGRLSAIFRGYEHWTPKVKPHFAVFSPRPPQRLDLRDAPSWMLGSDGSSLRWLELPMPDGLRKVTRCSVNGVPSAKGEYWRTVGTSGAKRSRGL